MRSWKWSRRQFIAGATLAAATGAKVGFGSPDSGISGLALGKSDSSHKDALVVIFLRGAADGLNIAPPYGEDEYYKLRPTLAMAAPSDRKQAASDRALDLNGFFGLHPSLAALLPIYREGEMGLIHAIGSDDHTRSHFEAMAQMERGIGSGSAESSGWLARHLMANEGNNLSPLRAVSLSETAPDSLRGSSSAVTLSNLSEFTLDHDGRIGSPTAFHDSLQAMYGGAKTSLHHAGAETLKALNAIRELKPNSYAPSNGAVYDKTETATALKQVACLMKGRIGMEVACLEMTGWDTHVTQGRGTGWQAGRLKELGDAVAAFYRDIGAMKSETTILIMTEFGRRAYENFSLGTDHGRASVWLTLGGGVNGGKVHGVWPTLHKDKLEGPGDLRVTTDYRSVLSELISKRLMNTHSAEVFPDWQGGQTNVFKQIAS